MNLPGRAGTVRRMGAAVASEIMTVTTATKLELVSRAIEHLNVSSSSQTVGICDSALPSFTSESSVCDLELDAKQYFFSLIFSDFLSPNPRTLTDFGEAGVRE